MIPAATYISLIVRCMSVCGVVASILFDFISQNMLLDLRFCHFVVYLLEKARGPHKCHADLFRATKNDYELPPHALS